MIIIGITGTLGAGKGTVVEHLVQEQGFVHFSVRGYLSELIKNKGKELNRDSLTHTANELRQKHGPSFIIEQLYEKAVLCNQNCIIESIRTPGEIDALRTKPMFFLLAVDADIQLRFKRIKQRDSETDRIDFTTFKDNETREMHSDDPSKQNLSVCINQADYVLYNNGTLEELHQKTNAVLLKITKQCSKT